MVWCGFRCGRQGEPNRQDGRQSSQGHGHWQQRGRPCQTSTAWGRRPTHGSSGCCCCCVGTSGAHGFCNLSIHQIHSLPLASQLLTTGCVFSQHGGTTLSHTCTCICCSHYLFHSAAVSSVHNRVCASVFCICCSLFLCGLDSATKVKEPSLVCCHMQADLQQMAELGSETSSSDTIQQQYLLQHMHRSAATLSAAQHVAPFNTVQASPHWPQLCLLCLH